MTDVASVRKAPSLMNIASSGDVESLNDMATKGSSWRRENSRPVGQYIPPAAHPAGFVMLPAIMPSHPHIIPSYQMAHQPVSFMPVSFVAGDANVHSTPTLAPRVQRSCAVPIIDPATRAQPTESRLSDVPKGGAATPSISPASHSLHAPGTTKSTDRLTSGIPIVSPAEFNQKEITARHPISIRQIPHVSPSLTYPLSISH